MKKKVIFYLLIVLAAIVFLVGCPPVDPGKEGDTQPNLIGTWKGTITTFTNPADSFSSEATTEFAIYITKQTNISFSGVAMVYSAPVSPADVGIAIDMAGTLTNNVVVMSLDFTPQIATVTFTMNGNLSGSTMTGTYLMINTSGPVSTNGTWQVVKQL